MKKQLILFLALCAIGAKAQFVNTDFEDWTKGNDSIYRPNNWIINNSMGNFGIFRDNDAQNGNYAMTLSRWYYYTYDDAVQTAATATKPLALKGFFRYTDNDIFFSETAAKDTAHVYVYAKKWNAATQQNDTIGKGHAKLSEAANWTAFSCPIYYVNNQMPDSITIRLAPTENNINSVAGLCNSNGNGWCSYFTVDNLNLSETVGITPVEAPAFSLYPNPANDKVFIAAAIQNNIVQYTLVDATGKTIMADNNYNLGKEIDLSGLSTGLYILRIDSNGKASTHKIIKQ